MKVGATRKTPDEVARIRLDFSPWLDTGETITALASEVAAPTNDAAPVTVSGLTSVVGNTAADFFIHDGTAGVSYQVVVTADTTVGRTKQATLMVHCRSATEGVSEGWSIDGDALVRVERDVIDRVNRALAVPEAPIDYLTTAAYRAGKVLGFNGDGDVTLYTNGTAVEDGVLLDAFGTVDRTGATDMAPLINAAITSTAADGIVLLIPAGQYRLASPLIVQTGLRMYCSSRAVFTAYFTTTGVNGVVRVPSFTDAEDPETRARDIVIRGGQWGRPGSGTETNWTGDYTGNIFSLYCDDLVLEDIYVKGYGPGRAMMLAGDRVVVRRCKADHCYPSAGAGGIRVIGGDSFRASDCDFASGDDCYQFVVGGVVGGLWCDLNITNGLYSNCHGRSMEGRIMVIGISTQNTDSLVIDDEATPVTLPALSAGVSDSDTVIPVTAGASLALAGYTLLAEATGEVMQVVSTSGDTSITVTRGFAGTTPQALLSGATLRVYTSQFRLTASVTDCAFVNVNGVGGGQAMMLLQTDSSGGIERILFSDCTIDDSYSDDIPASVAFISRLGRGIRDVRMKNVNIINPHKRSLEIAGIVQDVTYSGGTLAAPRVTGFEAVQIYGAKNVVLENLTINTNDPTMDVVRVGKEDAFAGDGLLVPGACENVVIEKCVIRGVGDDTYGVLVDDADGVQVIRTRIVKAEGATTARGVGFSTDASNGWVDRCDFRDCGHALPLLLGGTNNQGGVNFGVSPASQTSTQSAASGTLAWTDGTNLIRVNVAGTVTAISGTPTRAVMLVIRVGGGAGVGTIITNNSAIRLTPASDVTLDADESVVLEYDPVNGYWFQIGGGQR